MRLTEEEKAELRALASAPGLRSDLARLRNSHRDDFMVDGVVDSERVTEVLTAYSDLWAAGVGRGGFLLSGW